jgi:hypothetical protein
MLKTLKLGASAAGLALMLSVSAAATADTTPKAVDLLFEAKHIMSIAAGTELVYKFERKPSDEKTLGPGYTDDIKVKVEGDSKDGKKNVVVNMFTGERARDPNRIEGMDGNPMLVVYLDTALGHFQQLAGGERTYLKNTFSKSFLNDAKIEPVKVTYKGEQFDGHRVSVTPFTKDPARAKMRGFENTVFSIVVADKIPGQFALMTANFVNTDKDAPTLVENMTLEGVGDVK